MEGSALDWDVPLGMSCAHSAHDAIAARYCFSYKSSSGAREENNSHRQNAALWEALANKVAGLSLDVFVKFPSARASKCGCGLRNRSLVETPQDILVVDSITGIDAWTPELLGEISDSLVPEETFCFSSSVNMCEPMVLGFGGSGFKELS